MAKKRRKAKRRSSPRRSTRTITKYRTRSAPKRARRRRGGGGRSSGGLMPGREELYNMGVAAAYGAIERKAKTDQTFFLNGLLAKSPLPMLGFAGNVAVAARLVNHFAFRHPMLRRFANVTAEIAAYQIGRQGALFTTVAPFTVAGDGYDDDQLAGELDMGALAADADAHELEGYGDDDDDAMGGLNDEVVENIDEGF
jgi:hypothetical protein